MTVTGVPLVLATGGFQGDAELVERYVRPTAPLRVRANPWSAGDGLRVALEHGAALTAGLDEFYGRNMADVDFDERGFVFFTNRESRKGGDLANNPFAALVVYWPASGQQVRIEGRVEQVSSDESDAYFASRPRGSQIGAWASQQSRPLSAMAELEARTREEEARFPGTVLRPPYWGGYRVAPDRIEFWFDRKSRLHDRLLYARQADGSWKRSRLAP